jgi:microcystin degradation protein MlrC
MRFVTFYIILESNTFSPVKADINHFKKGNLFEGKVVIEYHTDKKTEMGGFISVAEAEKVELIPVLAAWGVSAGKVTKACYDFFCDSILEAIKKAGRIDGVLCALHGAMVAEHSDDPEGDLLYEIRNAVGEEIPIVTTLDFHANVTEKMVESTTMLVGYKTNPHVDFFECGQRGARLLIETVKGSIKPTMELKRLPMILPPENLATTQGPMVEEIEKTKRWEHEGTALSASVFAVQPWMDIKNLGWSMIAVTNADSQAAEKLAEDLAKACWSKRKKF